VVILEPTKDEEIFRTVIENGYDSMMAKLLVAQSRHETGNYKSRLARLANNMFGMQKPRRSHTRAIGTAWAEGRPNYAKYGSIEDSTLDVLDLLKRRNCPFNFKTTYEYAKWLKSKGYYEDSLENYSRALKRQLRQVTV
jgi:flagellum-specific peptidoglycan hydrolase FlgJ